jgi:hypothetical protein
VNTNRVHLVLAAASILTALAACLPLVPGCAANGQFTPAGAAGLDQAFAALCPLEDLVPGLGAACPGEDAAFALVTAADTATPAPPPDAGPPALAPLYRRGATPEPPLVHVGSVPPGPHLAEQRRRALALLGPVVATATSSPRTSSAPVVLPDAGADAGR